MSLSFAPPALAPSLHSENSLQVDFANKEAPELPAEVAKARPLLPAGNVLRQSRIGIHPLNDLNFPISPRTEGISVPPSWNFARLWRELQGRDGGCRGGRGARAEEQLAEKKDFAGG